MSQTSGMRLKVTPEELDNIAAEAEAYIQTLKTQFSQADKIVKGSTSYWEADGQSAYVLTYHSKSANTDQSLKKFYDHITNLRTIAGVYKTTEAQAVEAIQSLDSDVII